MEWKMWLFADNGCHDAARRRGVAELTKVDALPCAEIQSAVGDGNGERNSGQSRFSVCRHVVETFQRVFVKRLSFRHDVVEDSVKVGAHVGVGVFVDGQSATGVLYKQMEQSRAGKRWQLPEDFRSDKM